MFNNNSMNYYSTSTLKSALLKSYAWMAIALSITAIVSYGLYATNALLILLSTMPFLFMTLVIGLGVVIGHNFPFYLHFKGGKGIAVSAAVIVASSSNTSLGWIMIGVFLAVFIIVVGITRYVSLGSLIVVWYFPLYVILEYHRIETSLFVIMLFIALLFTALAYFKHAGNIRRLMNHTERKLGEKKEKENE